MFVRRGTTSGTGGNFIDYEFKYVGEAHQRAMAYAEAQGLNVVMVAAVFEEDVEVVPDYAIECILKDYWLTPSGRAALSIQVLHTSMQLDLSVLTALWHLQAAKCLSCTRSCSAHGCKRATT
eukprot:scaffold1762_cov383-Prasinococcus_capsulatus_cf.AAC.13